MQRLQGKFDIEHLSNLKDFSFLSRPDHEVAGDAE